MQIAIEAQEKLNFPLHHKNNYQNCFHAFKTSLLEYPKSANSFFTIESQQKTTEVKSEKQIQLIKQLEQLNENKKKM